MSSFGLAENFPPVTVVPFTISARTTSFARKITARSQIDGTSYRYRYFDVGMGGYDPFDVTKALRVDADAGTLIDPLGLNKPIDRWENPNPQAISYYCTLLPSEANYLLGEVGIWAEIQNSPNPHENGLLYLSAIGHFPAKAKNSDMTMALRVIQQL